MAILAVVVLRLGGASWFAAKAWTTNFFARTQHIFRQ